MLTEWQQTPQQWDARAATAKDGGLLQSWAWGEFQKALGNEVYRLQDEQTDFIVQAQRLRAGSQHVLVISRGPVGDNWSSENVTAFTKHIKTFAAEHGCFLVRLDAPLVEHDPAAALLTQSGWKKAYDRQPRHTLIIDTTSTEEQLLAAMKPKWRYNIKVAEKRGVQVRISSNPDDAPAFYDLMFRTTERQQFASYDAAYFRKLMQSLGPTKQAAFIFAELENKPIAALLITSFGNTSIYLHGASDYEHRNAMAPHLLQWEAIKAAKNQGQRYDFWGVAANPPANDQEKSWAGITRFKQGFSVQTTITGYLGTYELPVKPALYFLYSLRQKLRGRTN